MQQFEICQKICFWFSIKSFILQDFPQSVVVMFWRYLKNLIYLLLLSIWVHWHICKDKHFDRRTEITLAVPYKQEVTFVLISVFYNNV